VLWRKNGWGAFFVKETALRKVQAAEGGRPCVSRDGKLDLFYKTGEPLVRATETRSAENPKG